MNRAVPRARLLTLATLLLALLVPTVALAAFPGSDPDESVRQNAPDDPGFDRCEPDNDGGPTCSDPFDQDYERFGFAPEATDDPTDGTAIYKNDNCELAVSAATLGLCGDPKTRRLIQQNLNAGRNGPGQLSGYSADRAWKYFGEPGLGNPDGLVGDPEVEVAILDTGILWDKTDLRDQIALNEEELPEPQDAAGNPCGADDCNGDGAFNVDDYADDTRVAKVDGHDSADSLLDASDLIAVFSDPSFSGGGVSGDADDDGNGFVDDIAGWDFFDDDNDPYDASSYSAADGHGSGRAQEAGGGTDNAIGNTGVCPACQIVPLRVWDTFVLDTNQFALGTLYAADNEIEVVEGAVGGLSNTRFARESFAYAYEQGTLPVIVSSDLNTANHNYPTNYDQALHVQGAVADAQGLGENPPQEFIDFFNGIGVPLGTSVPVGTWFRNSGLTQYGGHAHVVMMGPTGSANTGQASGAAGLLFSYANLAGITLEPNEVKQLMTITAEDVHSANVSGLGVPDPALDDSWDQHFGYGRVDLAAAVEAIREEADGSTADGIPPQALITAPDWFSPLNVELQNTVDVEGFLAAERGPGKSYDWELRWAAGIEPCPSDFDGASQLVADGSGSAPSTEKLGELDLEAIRAALDARTQNGNCGNPGPVDGGATVDPTAPLPGPGDLDPNEPAFTVKLTVTDADGLTGEDRKVLFAHRDETIADGWHRPIGAERDPSGEADGGGESSHRMFDVDGDNELELIEATSSGELHVVNPDGTPEQSFNDGEPVSALQVAAVHPDEAGFDDVDPPLASMRIPAIGDIDGDLEAEIVVTAGEHTHAWELDGTDVDGWPVRIDPSHSKVSERSRANHIKRGFIASPTLADLDGDGDMEVIAPGLDQWLYVYDGDGSDFAGFPVFLRERDGSGNPLPCTTDFPCAETINTAAVGDITGDEVPEIVVPTAEFDDEPGAPGTAIGAGTPSNALINLLANALGGSSRIYAIDSGGDFVPGWPIAKNGILPDVLPLVAPGVDQAMANIDGDPELEVIGNIATGQVTATDGDGSEIVGYQAEPSGGDHADKSVVLNLFENPIAADLDGLPGPEVIKGGLTTGQLANLAAVGQNAPYNHVVQAWNGQTGASLPAFPQAVEDYQLLSSPAVADVSSAPGREVIVGTGLYLIRAINAAGTESGEWPKFTGGWNFAVPAIGDVDADGLLEVSAQTREGFAFLWETDSDACGGTNDQWWTFRHDEFNTGAHGTDARPPGVAEELTAERADDGSIELSFAAPGDDWLCGTAEKIRIVKAGSPIKAPTDGTVVRTDDAVAGGGEETMAQISSDEFGDASHLAVLYRDEAGNWGQVASVEVPAVPTGPGGGGDGGDGGGNGGGSGGDSDSSRDPFAPARCETSLLSADFSRAGSGGGETIIGTPGDDVLNGNGGRDTVVGLAGDDCLTGDGGRDTIRGKSGADVALGGGGGDFVKGNSGDDLLEGGPGRDRLRSAGGEDVVRGQGGDDNLSSGNADDRLSGGPGDDRLFGNEGDDTIRGGKGDDVLFGGGGKRNILRGGPGKDRCIIAKRRKNEIHSCEKVLVGGARG